MNVAPIRHWHMRATWILYLILLLVAVLGGPVREAYNPAPAHDEIKGESCKPGPGERWLNVLPGVGWDNLVNEERGPTIDRERYDQCRRSANGGFLIPDDISIEPRKNSELDLTSEVFESTSQCTSVTAYSINSAIDFGASYYRINGDFSFEKESLRETTGASKGLVVRTQLRHKRYTVQLMPDSTLQPRLRNRLLDIAVHLERGNVTLGRIDQFDRGNTGPDRLRHDQNLGDSELTALEEGMQAFYLADLIVRDYGTHSISSVDAGGLLVKTDILNEDSASLTDHERWKVAASATTTFASMLKLNVGGSMSVNQSTAEQYSRKSMHSRITSFGGPIFRAYQMNLSEWEDGLENELVAIDRSGQPIHELITERSMPELAEHVVLRLAKTIKSAVERYYKSNAVIGCMDPNSKLYDREANVDSADCTGSDSNRIDELDRLPLGGVFQKCDGPQELCAMVSVKNPATGDFSCPLGYIAVQLLPSQVRSCVNTCHKSTWAQPNECQQECAVTVLYWCSLDPSLSESPNHEPKEIGLVFGGLYTDKDVNPVTHQFNCPEYSWPLAMGRRMRICLSTDRELGGEHAMRFGGFYSCQFGNPLVSLLLSDRTNSSKQIALRSWLNATVVLKKLSDQEPPNQSLSSVPPEARSGPVENPSDPALEYSDLFASLWPKRCPDGYTSHLAAMEETCQVSFCVPANTMKTKRKRYLKRPPFVIPFAVHRVREFDSQYNNVPLTLPGPGGTQLARIDGVWIGSQPKFVSPEQLRQQTEISIALGSVLALVVLLVFTAGVCMALMQRFWPNIRRPAGGVFGT